MSDNMAAKRRAIAKAIYILIIGWIWIVSSLVTFYLIATNVLWSGSWWNVLASSACAWLFYRLAKYYDGEYDQNLTIADTQLTRGGAASD